MSALRQVQAQCGSARVVSGYRRGATIRGTRRVSQHSFCNGKNGAIDVVFSNRACALSALRKTNYTILTYGSSRHIHIGTDGWGYSGTRVAHRHPGRVRTASKRRSTVRAAYRQRSYARSASRSRAGTRAGWRQRASMRVAHGQRSQMPPTNWNSSYE
jgi:hypothetical protein